MSNETTKFIILDGRSRKSKLLKTLASYSALTIMVLIGHFVGSTVLQWLAAFLWILVIAGKISSILANERQIFSTAQEAIDWLQKQQTSNSDQ